MTTPLIEAMARAAFRAGFHPDEDQAHIDEKWVEWDDKRRLTLGIVEAALTAITEAGYAIAPTQDVQCETMEPQDDDGWSEWIHPLPGYLLQCCDCGLVHEMEYAIVPSHENCGDGELNEGETKDSVIIFRARRAMIAATNKEGK